MFRLRPVENLLGKYNELEKQEIYFASPEELNDPMEGFQDIYWKGDSIVWKNLFIHYLRCLERILGLSILLPPTGRELCRLDIINIISRTPERTTTFFGGTVTTFFGSEFFKLLPEVLSKRKKCIRRDELLYYFKLIHPFAVDLTQKEGRLSQDLEKRPEKVMKIIQFFGEKEEFSIEKLFSPLNGIWGGMQLNQYLNSNIDFLFSFFPEQFLQSLEFIVKPNWFSASFMSECSNSSVWSHYGDGHKGVCLIFNTEKKEGKVQKLLNTKKGQMVFDKIVYNNKHVEIDFFRSLVRVSKRHLWNFWYMDEAGNKSVCSEHLENDTNKWRHTYWEKLKKV